MSTGSSTPLPQKYSEWLIKAVGSDGASGMVAEKTKLDDKEDRRQARLDKIRGELDGVKGEIQQQMNILVVVKGKNLLGMTSKREVSSMGKGGSDSLLDPTLDTPNVESIPEEARRRAQQAGEKMIKMSLRAQGYIHESDWKAVADATKTKSAAEVAAEWGVSEKTVTMVVDRYNETQQPGYQKSNSERLVNECVGDPDEVLDDQELLQEFWKPLVREGVYPENFVIDRYDEDTQLFRGAAEQYDARIEEVNESYNEAEVRKQEMAGKTQHIQECTETAKALAEAAGYDLKGSPGDLIEIASALASAGVAMYDNWDDKDAENAIPALGKVVEKIYASVFDKATAKSAIACFQATIKGGAFCSHLMSSEPDSTKKAYNSLGDAAFAAFGASESTAKFGAALKTAFYTKVSADGAYKEIQKLRLGQATIADVITAVKEAGKIACDAAKKDLISEEQAEAVKLALDLTESAAKNLTSRKLLDAAKDVGNLFASVVVPQMVPGVGECFTLLRATLKVDQFSKLVREGNMEEADKLVDEAIKSIEAKVKDWKKDQEKQEKEKEKEPTSPSQGESGDGSTGEGGGEGEGEDGDGDEEEDAGDEEGSEPTDESAFGLFTQIKNRVTGVDSIQQAFDEKTEQVDAQQQEDEDEAFSAQLAMTFGESDGDPEILAIQKEVQSIDRLIKQVHKDQALLKMADKIFDAGVKSAAQFYGALKSVGNAKNLIRDMVGAGRRYLELTRWIELHQVALQAASAQGFALASQVTNLKIDVGRKTLSALCELGQLSGTALGALAGTAAGPGGTVVGAGLSAKAFAAGAKATKGIAELCMKFYSNSELRTQWKLYGEAKQPPTDRRKMRAALRGNSTLAKYAMAFAAVENGDPIASEGLRLCGLTEETLNHPATDVAKVVRFLELKFEQDPQVLQASTAQAWQADKSNALTLASWATNVKAAREKNVLDEAAQTAAIEDALTGVQASQDALDEVDDDSETVKQKYDDQAGQYEPLLEVHMNQNQRCVALEAFLNTRASDSEKLKREIGSATNVTASKRKEYETQLNKLDRDLTDCEATLTTGKSSAAAYEKTIAPFVATIDPYAQAITDYAAAFLKCESALATLGGALKAFKPKKKQGPTTVDSPEVQAYAQALLKSIGVAETSLKTKKDAIDGLITGLPEAKSAAGENESNLATATGKMDELLRKAQSLKLEVVATRNKLGLLPTTV